MKGRSCLTNILMYLDKITTYIDEGLPIDAIYLNFSKAFDRVQHRRLAMKLNAHGIRDENRWITERLLGRVQRVIINGTSSGGHVLRVVSPKGQSWNQFYL